MRLILRLCNILLINQRSSVLMVATQNMKTLYWVASYVKSGNTWVRCFITALNQLLFDETAKLDINDLHSSVILVDRDGLGNLLGIDVSDFSEQEIRLLRKDAHKHLAEMHAKMNSTILVKIHDAFTYCDEQKTIPLFEPEVSAGVIYIVRNPFDIAVSLANHIKTSIEECITLLGQSAYSPYSYPKNFVMAHPQLTQEYLTWSQNVESWCLQDTGIPTLCLFYEDMVENPFPTFKRLAKFCTKVKSDKLIEQALEATDFQQLRSQENERGFGERLEYGQQFFRKGVVGDWRQHLSTQQIKQMVETHKTMLRWAGYIDENSRITEKACGSN